MSEPRRITERYRLEKRVSSRDSGSVFRAVDTLSGEIVAVKLINAGDSEEHREPFETHLAALQGVHHPALPRILDFGFTTAGSAFLITEYLAGDDLSDLVDAPPPRVLALLLQLTDGLEALASRGLAVRNLSPENLRVVPGPEGEQVKILGLGDTAYAGDRDADGPRADLRAFAHLTVRALGLPERKDEASITLPLHVAGALTEPERLRELLDAALQGDPEGRFPDWKEVRRALRTALFGGTGRRPELPTQMIPVPPLPPPPAPGTGTVQIPRISTWEEVRLGQGAPPPLSFDGDATMAVERIGPAPAQRPAPPDVPDLTTRVFRPEELTQSPAATAPAVPPPPPAAPGGGTVRIEAPLRARGDAGRQGTVRIPLKELEQPPAPPPAPASAPPAPAPAAATLRFPTPTPPPPPPPPPAPEMEETLARRGATLPFPAPAVQPVPPPPAPAPVAAPMAAPLPAAPPLATPLPVPAATQSPAVPQPAAAPAPAVAPQAAAPRRPPGKGLRIGLLVGVPVALLLVVVGLVAWLSRRSAQPQPPPQQVQAPPPKPVPKPLPAPPAPKPVHAQILLAEESLNASDLAGAKTYLDAIPPEQIALFTAEEQDRYQRARDALTPLQSQQWAESLTRGLSSGDLRLLRAAAAAPPDAATLTPEQKKGLARARKILDLDSKLSKAQRAKDHPETLRQARLLLAELPESSRAGQARTQAADALLAEADDHAAQGELDAALAALEHLRDGWRDHPGLAERLERVRAERRANEQLEEALAAATRAERAERPLDGLQALDRVRPNERFAERFRQTRERLQAQFARLDQNPPQIAMAGPSELSYKEEETVTILLRITDDQGVESTEAWARSEGGRFTKVPLRHLGGSEYALDVRPDVHQRKSIDFYVTATDQSEHQGSLGSVQRPQKIKRKGWLSKVLGGKEGG